MATWYQPDGSLLVLSPRALAGGSEVYLGQAINRASWRKHLAEVKVVLKNLAAVLRTEANRKTRDLPWDLRDRIHLATSCV